MRQNKNTISTSKAKIIITAMLLFIFYGSYSQTNKTAQKPFTLDFKGGVNMPIGDFKDYAKNGFQAGLMLNKTVYKNLGLGVSANYNHFGLKDNFESPDNAWSAVSLAVGPQYTLPTNMFFIQLYGHIGMSLFKAPGITKDVNNIPDYINVKEYEEGFFNTFKMESESTTGFHTDIGIKLGAELTKRVSLFVGSTYTTSLNSPIKHNSRDISKAFHPSGEVDIDMIRETPFEEKSFALSSYYVNAGITINLGRISSARAAQDYNSSRSNRPTPIAWSDAVINNVSVPQPLHAQDYNSSRSNKPRPIFNTSENDTVQRAAQDYNSSRSNRPTPIAWSDAVTDNDSVPQPLHAQDYNSSRSNKPRPIFNTSENDTLQRPAQDYNSSRSNKPSPIAWSDEEVVNDTVPKPVQDYNSSRSNRPRPIARVFDTNGNDTVPTPVYAQDYNSSRSNKPSPIAWLFDTNGNDTVPTPLYAQDYNSSRSNKPRPIAWSDEEVVNDTVPKPVQDYNSSRSNRPRPIAWLFDTNGNDTVPTPLYAQDYNSSRSNKPRPIAWSDDKVGNDTVPKPVQDYNSSRSNRPRPITFTDDINDIDNDEDGVVISGKLTAIDLKIRSFELIDKNKQKITGQFQPKVTNEEINNLRRNFLNKQANIHVKIKKTKLETGREIVSYEL